MKPQLLPPTIENLNLARENPGTITFNTDSLKTAINQNPDFNAAFYNKKIEVNIHTDGQVGHVSGNLPCLQPNGTIKIERFIGLDPKHNDEDTYNKIFGCEGNFSIQDRSAASNHLLTASIPVTQEVYNKLAQMTAERKENPGVTYAVHGNSNNNCIHYMNQLLTDAGVAGGIHNKFNYKDFQSLDFKAIKWQAQFFFDEFKIALEQTRAAATYDLEEYKIESVYNERIRNQLAKKQQQTKDLQIDNDISLFLSHIQSTNASLQLSAHNNAPSNSSASSSLLPGFWDYYEAENLEKNYGLTFLKKEGGQSFFQLNENSPLNLEQSSLLNVDLQNPELANELAQSIINNLDLNAEINAEIGKQVVAQDDKTEGDKPKEKQSLITDVRFGAIGGGIATGLIFQIVGGGEVAVGIGNSGGFILSIGANFGPQFWSALGISLGFGACIAAVAITAQILLKKHYKRIEHHLKKDFKKTENDLALINKKMTDLSAILNSEAKKDLDKLIAETNSAIRLIQEKIQQISKRADYAFNHKQKKAGKGYEQTNKSLRDQAGNLVDIKNQLHMQKVYTDFVEKHANADCGELIHLAKTTTGKGKFTKDDMIQISGLRNLILQKIITLMGQGNAEGAIYLLSQTSGLQYFPAGEYSFFHPSNVTINVKKNEKAWKKWQALQTQWGNFHLNIKELNEIISTGKDPRAKLTQLAANLKLFRTSLVDLINTKGVSGNLPEILTRFDAWNKTISELSEQFTSGNLPQNLDLKTLENITQKFFQDDNKQPEYWLDILKNNQTSTNNNGADPELETKLLNQAFSSWKIINLILAEAASGEFTKALDITNKLKDISPDHVQLANTYLIELQRFQDNKDAGLDFWLAEINNCKKTPKDQNGDRESFIQAIAPSFITRFVFKEIADCNFEQANKILLQWEQTDPDQKETISGIRQKIQFGQDNLTQDDVFWIKQLKPPAPSPTEQEDEKTTDKKTITTIEDALAESVALAILNKRTTGLAETAFFGKAAILMDEINKKRPDLKLDKTIKEFYFQHHGQILNAFLQPLEGMITREVTAMQPSWKKTCFQFVLGGVNAAQVVVPNILPLALQGAHAHWLSDTEIFLDNLDNLKNSAMNVLKAPFIGFTNPANGLKAPTAFDVGLVYTQLGLMALHHGGEYLEIFIPNDYLTYFDSFRAATLSVGNAGVSTAFTYNALSKLTEFGFTQEGVMRGLGHAYAPFNVASLGKLAVNTGLWGMHKCLSYYGNDIESPNWYAGENAFNAGLTSVATVAFVTAITGGFGFWAWAATALSAIAFTHDVTCETTAKNNAAAALVAAINNIEYLVKNYPNSFNQKIQSGLTTIRQILDNTFQGLQYRETDQDIANGARATHLFYSLYHVGFNQILLDTNTYGDNDPPVISSVYRLPAYMILNTIIGLRLAKICEQDILSFRDNYQSYTDYIFRSAPDKWRKRYLNTAMAAFNDVLKFAFYQYVNAALNEPQPSRKSLYLDNIMLNYNHAKEWSEILTIELKFWTAYIYHSIGQEEKAATILSKTDRSELKSFLESQQNSEIPNNALIMISEVDESLRNEMLSNRVDYHISDTHIIKAVKSQIGKGKFVAAKKTVDGASVFPYKSTLYAMIVFESSKGCEALLALKILDSLENRQKETNRNGEFWHLLLQIAMQFEKSTKYRKSINAGNKDKLFFMGLQKLAIDRLLSIPNLSLEFQLRLGILNKELIENLSEELGDNYQILVEQGHKCLRGETSQTLYENVERILESSVLRVGSSIHSQTFIPIETPPDGDCAFTCLGLTRSVAVRKLKDHVQPLNIAFKLFYKNKQNAEVIEILLKNLEDLNHTSYNRDENHALENIQQIVKQLDIYNQSGVYMPYTEGKWGVLDALALIQKKNLCIYRMDENNNLVIATQNINDPEFETIHMLHTSAEGLTNQASACNHFIRLETIALKVQELTLSNHVNDTVQHPTYSSTSKRSFVGNQMNISGGSNSMLKSANPLALTQLVAGFPPNYSFK